MKDTTIGYRDEFCCNRTWYRSVCLSTSPSGDEITPLIGSLTILLSESEVCMMLLLMLLNLVGATVPFATVVIASWYSAVVAFSCMYGLGMACEVNLTAKSPPNTLNKLTCERFWFWKWRNIVGFLTGDCRTPVSLRRCCGHNFFKFVTVSFRDHVEN